MKTVFAAAAIALTACAPVVADEEVSTAEWCGAMHGLAEEVMTSRQIGVPMPDVMAVADGLPAMERMTMVAYDMPRMSVEGNQNDMIADFANDVYRECLEANE